MNFQKPNGKRVTEAIVSVVAVGAGMILSKGISEVIPVDNSIAKKAITGTLGLVGSTPDFFSKKHLCFVTFWSFLDLAREIEA